MGLNEAGNVEVKISFIPSSDAANFTPFPVTAESLSVVDGKISTRPPQAWTSPAAGSLPRAQTIDAALR